MPDPTATPSVASPPDPPAPTTPSNITVLLHAARTLLAYGRHLVDTLRQRAAAPNFAAIASNFGTANLSTILAHLNRGLLRAAALERFLLARAATGRDIAIIEPHTLTDFVDTPDPQPAAPPIDPPQPAAAAAVPGAPAAPRPARAATSNAPGLLTPQDLDREVRSQPVGRTLLDICLDLAVVPGLCHSAFWNELFELITYFGASVAPLMLEKARRTRAYAKEQDRNPNATWQWLTMSRDALRQVLGFFIGEPPVNPFEPETALATGPP